MIKKFLSIHILFCLLLFTILTYPCSSQNAVDIFGSYPKLSSLSWVPSSPEEVDELWLNPRKSDWIQPLDGKWEFLWLPELDAYLSPERLPSPNWNKVDVPGNWQLEFDYDPPIYGTPGDEATQSYLGVYRRKFVLPPSWKKGEVFLRMHGGGPEASISLNGSPILTARLGDLGSSIPLNDNLKKGENTLIIQVLHDPQKFPIEPFTWKLGGLDRHISLVFKKPLFLKDLSCQADGDGFFALKGEAFNASGAENKGLILEYKLIDPNGNTALQDQKKLKSENKSISFSLNNKLPYVYNWSAEEPYLYELKISLKNLRGEIIEHSNRQIGFCEKKEKAGKIWINNKSLLLKAVYYRFFDPERGYGISVDKMKKDLLMMKAHHINAVYITRAAPTEFYALCDEIGLYVISQLGLDKYLDMDYAERRIKWEREFASVILHIHPNRFSLPSDAPEIPFWPMEKFSAATYLKSPKLTLGDGRLAMDSLRSLKSINVLGGWADQALHFDNKGKKLAYRGPSKYGPWTYPHCLDGWVDADRKAQPELEKLKQLYAPVSLDCHADHLILKHDFAFRNLTKVNLMWEITEGDSVRKFMSQLPPYFRNFFYKIPYPFSDLTAGTCIRVRAFPSKNHPFLPDTLLLGEGSYCQSDFRSRPSARSSSKLKVLESITSLDVYSPEFVLSFDKGIRMLESIRVGKEEILAKPPSFQFSPFSEVNQKIKAIQDNQQLSKPSTTYQLTFDKIEVLRYKVEEIKIMYRGNIILEDGTSFKLTCTYAIQENGEIKTDISILPERGKLKQSIEQVWQLNLGRGSVSWKKPGRSPQTNSISNFNYPFLLPLYPQRETNTSWVSISPLDRYWQLYFYQKTGLSFNITNVELQQWYEAMHKEEIRASQTSIFAFGPFLYDEKSKVFRLNYKLQISKNLK